MAAADYVLTVDVNVDPDLLLLLLLLLLQRLITPARPHSAGEVTSIHLEAKQMSQTFPFF